MPQALVIRKNRSRPGSTPYYPLQLKAVEKPSPGANELLVRIEAAALNHSDLFIRQNLYPNISFEAPLLSDGCGTVVEEGPGCTTHLLHKLVVLTPCRGWAGSPEGPEDWAKFRTIGGTEPYVGLGAAQHYIVVGEDEVEQCPEHLTAAQAAAIPVCGLTAWRALFVKSHNARPGRNILITGIGGGVALQVLLFARDLDCNIFVTSSSPEKIARAEQLGAKAGVMYSRDDWPAQLKQKLPAERPFLDAVIDGAGGDIAVKTTPILKPGGVIVNYGMGTSRLTDWPMQAVYKNIELRGSTAGSRTEFGDMIAFIRERRIVPIISRMVRGLYCVEAIDGLFEDMKAGKQFGKLVIEV
ncbi:putative secondary metabolism biosynthetic enzyme [Claviceps africana]|uniref:Secondary metabolism biosynthetic enzyme n=1 Tax=Claviceps africana TaxID=83212 RepID=A0A8K0NM17_9HYPO|nr:putative secondary metabolism biosynthetic enzyme [Claviceps africana]